MAPRQPLFGRRYDAGREQLLNNPQYKMGIQAQQRGMSTEPVSSPWEGLARALQAPLGAVMAGQQEAAMKERQGERNQQIVDTLLGDRGMTGETEPGTGQRAQSPQRQQMEQQLMGMLESGVVQPGDLSEVMMQQMGFGPQAKPIEVNGRLVDPNTYEVIQDFSDPNIRSVNGRLVNVDTGQVMADFSDPRTLGKSDLVQVMTDQGPQYVPASQAVGQRPYEGGSQDQRERKIEYWTQQLGGDEAARRRAAGIVDGMIDIEIVPETGMARLIDKTSDQVSEIPIGTMQPDGGQGQAQGPGVMPPPSNVSGISQEDTLYGAAESQGLWPSVQEAWSTSAGQIPGVPIAEDVIKDRANLRAAQGELRRGVAINPRFPVGEMERIEEEFDIDPSAFDSPRALRGRMREIHSVLSTRQKQAEEDAADPSLPQDTRSAQAQNARFLSHFLERLGVPESAGQQSNQQQGGGNGGSLPRIQNNQEYENLPSGTEFIAPDGTRRRKQ